MRTRFRTASSLALWIWVSPTGAFAQEAAPAPIAEEPSPEAREAPEAPSAPPEITAAPTEPPLPLAEDYAYWIAREQRLTSTLQLYASVHGTRRRTLSAMTIVMGLIMVPIGTIADVVWDEPYGVYLWSFGGAAIVTGAIAGFASSPIERVQREYLDMDDMSPRLRVTTTERLWADKATRRRRLRLAAFGTEVALGAAAITMAFVVGVGTTVDWTEGHRRTTAVATGVAGPIVVARGVTHWFAMSDIETAHLAYERSITNRSVDYTIGATAVRGGAVVGVNGTF